MDNLQEYMKDHKVEIKDEKPLFGDEERFFMKLDASRAATQEQQTGIHFHSSIKRRKIPFWRVVAVPAAAAVLIFLSVGIYMKSFSESGTDELNKIYLEYQAEVTNLSSEINSLTVSDIEKEINERTIENITFEAVPITSQLPAEMTKKEKTQVVKDYYSQKLDGIRRLKNLVSESMID